PGRSALRSHRRPRRRSRHPARHASHAGNQPGHARRAGRLRTARRRLSGYARRPAPGAGRDRPDPRGPRLRQLSAVHPRRHAGADSRGPAAPAWRQARRGPSGRHRRHHRAHPAAPSPAAPGHALQRMAPAPARRQRAGDARCR
ncbi:hypothetical protein OY671_013098, partial [Metschnikowia pulcherrima]